MAQAKKSEDGFDAYRRKVLSSFRDADIVDLWAQSNLLAQLRQKNKGRQKQVIHDIPRPPCEEVTPYDLAHRVQKDMYFKIAALMGFNVTYAPSWNLFDPAVEACVTQDEHEAGRLADAVTVRRESKALVGTRMADEKALLQRLGIFADWRGVRPQLEPRYEARLLEGFGELMDRDFLTKEAKPSYWCIQCQSILTDDELVYKAHKWAAAYVRFPVREGVERLGPNVSLLVWVVELWALPAGIAVALPKTGQYVAVDCEGDRLIIEQETAEKILDSRSYEVLEELDAGELLKCTCSHPLLDVELPVVQSESNGHARKVTGVYLAIPGHNQDDYAVRLENNYKIV